MRSIGTPNSRHSVTRSESVVGLWPLATSRNVRAVSTSLVSPSATAHAVPVVLVASVACPSYQVVALPGHHIDRSTTTGTRLVDSTRIETEVAASAGSTSSTGIVSRPLAGTWNGLTIGA